MPHRFRQRKRLLALPGLFVLLYGVAGVVAALLDMFGEHRHGDSLAVLVVALIASAVSTAWLGVTLRWANRRSTRFQALTNRRLLLFTPTTVASLRHPTILQTTRRTFSHPYEDLTLALTCAGDPTRMDVTLFGLADARGAEAQLTRIAADVRRAQSVRPATAERAESEAAEEHEEGAPEAERWARTE